jgi:CDP-diacylglycerol--inositol 3-phosphatidyltransferase
MTNATPQQILLYIPNLIGYLRILLTISSLSIMILLPSHWFLATLLYIASFVGDLFDGMAARKLGQTSTFGGLMDMVTDRCSTTGLLCVLVAEFAERSGYVLASLNHVSLCFVHCSVHRLISFNPFQQYHSTAIHTINHDRHLLPLVSNVFNYLTKFPS